VVAIELAVLESEFDVRCPSGDLVVVPSAKNFDWIRSFPGNYRITLSWVDHVIHPNQVSFSSTFYA